MGLLNKINKPQEEVAVDEDFVGGGGVDFPTDVYDANVKSAYLLESRNGAIGINLTLEIDGKELSETAYITNRNKDITYKDKKTGEPRYMPSYSILNSLSLLVSGKSILENDTPDKTLMLWDFEAKKDLPKEVPVLEDWLGKEVKVAVQQSLEATNTKNDDGDWVPAYDDNGDLKTYKKHSFIKFYRMRDGLTTNEITAKLEEATHLPKWIEKNKDVVRDNTKDIPKKVTANATSGNLSTSQPVPAKSDAPLFQ